MVMTTVVVIVVAVTKVVVTKNMTDGCDHNRKHSHSRTDYYSDSRTYDHSYCYIDAFISSIVVQR